MDLSKVEIYLEGHSRNFYSLSLGYNYTIYCFNYISFILKAIRNSLLMMYADDSFEFLTISFSLYSEFH